MIEFTLVFDGSTTSPARLVDILSDL